MSKKITLPLVIITIGLVIGISVWVWFSRNLTLPAKIAQPPKPAYSSVQDVLKSVEASKSADQLNEYVKAVQDFARATEVLELKDCQPDPLVFKADKGKEFEIRNKGEKDIKLVLSIGKEYQIPANGSITAKGILDAAIYYYQCIKEGEKPGNVIGLIYIIESQDLGDPEQAAAEVVDSIVVDECVISPRLFKVKKGRQLSVLGRDGMMQVLVVDKGPQYKIPGKEPTKVDINLGKGSYRVACRFSKGEVNFSGKIFVE